MYNNRTKLVKIIVLFLAIVLLMTGCGLEESRKTEESGQDGRQENLDAWNPEGETLYAQYQEVFLGDSRREARKRLIKMNCLATRQGVYVTGIRNNQDVTEAAFYLLTQEAEPCLAATYSGERAIAWCGTDEGIAFLGAKASQAEDAPGVEYLLRFLQWDAETASLKETETIDLTECFAEAEMETSLIETMVVGEGHLFFGDLMEQRILAAKRSAPMEFQWIEVGEYVNRIWCPNTEETFVLTTEGELYSWTPESGTLKRRTEEPLGQFGINNYGFPGEDWVYAGSRQSLYAYRMDGKKSQKLMDYEIELSYFSSLWMDEATGQGVLASWDSDGDTVRCYYLSAQPVEKETEVIKEIVTLEQFYVDSDLKQAVAAFNEQSDKYQVEIVEAGKTMDYDTFGMQLQARLVAGEGPDLVNMSTDTRFKNYVKAGAFEDLVSWIERDLDPEDYVQSALYAYEMADGGVYALGASFCLSVVVADRRLVGDGEDWSLQRMFQMMETSELDVLYKGYKKEFMLDRFCLAGLDDQIYDMDKVAECILFAEKYGDDEQDTQSWSDKVIPGQDTGIVTEIINDPLDVPDILRYYGENAVILGYPEVEGSRVVSEFSPAALSISATSKNKEGAWAFLKFLLEEDYQWSVKDSFPVLREAFDAMLEQYQSPQTFDVYLEETGEVVTMPNEYYLNRCSRDSSWENWVRIESVSEEETEMLRALAEKSRAVVCNIDFYASQIILEEVQSYYQGDKSLEEVLKIMEGRLKIQQAE